MRYGLLAVSIFTVLAITLNRYIMIGHPRLYPKYVFLFIYLFLKIQFVQVCVGGGAQRRPICGEKQKTNQNEIP
jgi:hypothetical protein